MLLTPANTGISKNTPRHKPTQRAKESEEISSWLHTEGERRGDTGNNPGSPVFKWDG